MSRVRLVLSAALGVLMTLASVAIAVAGDGTPPYPK